MLSTRKKTSVVSMLQDRELNLKNNAYFSTINIMRRLISSDSELYTKKSTKTSKKEISYKDGSFFFRNYAEYYPVNAINKQTKESPSFFSMESNNKKRICHAISYSGKTVSQNIADVCRCELERCICLSPCLLSITNDSWLYQHLLINGKLVKEIYLSDIEKNVKFEFCMWDAYGERFSLANEPDYSEENDVVTHLLALTFPLEFYIHLEIKRSVFGKDVKDASFQNNLLMVEGREYTFYNFDEFIKQGTLTPYRLGDSYKDHGKIGSYPIGLPLNFTYDEAPPILFTIAGFDTVYEFCFGGYPLQYITLHPFLPTQYYRLYDVRITAVETNIPIQLDKSWLIKYRQYSNKILYHPDNSNRIILKMYDSLDIYKIIREKNNSRICKQFSFPSVDESSGTGLRNNKTDRLSITVRDFDYEPELGIIGILAESQNDGSAFVKLYDNVTGEDLRTIEINEINIDMGNYWLYIHPCAIIIHESGGILNEKLHAVHVYMM